MSLSSRDFTSIHDFLKKQIKTNDFMVADKYFRKNIEGKSLIELYEKYGFEILETVNASSLKTQYKVYAGKGLLISKKDELCLQISYLFDELLTKKRKFDSIKNQEDENKNNEKEDEDEEDEDEENEENEENDDNEENEDEEKKEYKEEKDDNIKKNDNNKKKNKIDNKKEITNNNNDIQKNKKKKVINIYEMTFYFWRHVLKKPTFKIKAPSNLKVVDLIQFIFSTIKFRDDSYYKIDNHNISDSTTISDLKLSF
jgi:hypothetical protein